MSKCLRLLVFALSVALLTPTSSPSQSTTVGELKVGAPLRVRDMTFPSQSMLGFMPSTAASLGKGRSAWEVDYSLVSNWQLDDDSGEAYLGETRPDGERRRLDDQDAQALLRFPAGQAYYTDGEFGLLTLSYWRGLTGRLDLGVSFHYISYSGGFMDGFIEGFHDSFGFTQQGRNFVEQDQFQIALGPGDTGAGFALLDRPTSGGVGDPFVHLRYALPGTPGGWMFNVEGALKFAVADHEDFLSTGNEDYGLRLTADKQWNKNGLIVEGWMIFPGDVDLSGRKGLVGDPVDRFEAPSVLPGFHVTYLHRFGPKFLFTVQLLTAENLFKDIGASALSELEFMTTFGFKWYTGSGVWGLGITENLLNYDNTPDIGVHLSWALLRG